MNDCVSDWLRLLQFWRRCQETGHMRECDVRLGWHPRNATVTSYGPDSTGTVTYRFNSRRYRGEEYRAASRFRICLIGDGHGFGTGLPLEHTFGFRLKQHVAAALDADDAEVNLVNLSAGGVSADYCLRTLYRQLPEHAFDTVICQLPPADRAEFFDGKMFRVLDRSEVRPGNRHTAPVPLLAFCDFYNEFVGTTALLKNVLLMQDDLVEKGVPYVIATEDAVFAAGAEMAGGSFADYLSMIDRHRIMSHRFFASMADQGACREGAGRRTHAAFAIALLHVIGETKIQDGHGDVGRRLAEYAAHLKATDADWQFWIARSAAHSHLERRWP